MTPELHLLIAEDNVEIRESMAKYFKNNGWYVLAVESGDEAFGLIKQRQFSLLITDLRMANGTGIELLRRLRILKKNKIPVPPIIITTGMIGEGEPMLRALGVAEIFLKPFDMKRLMSTAVSLTRREN